MLNLRMVRGPLAQAEYETILKQYNQMTSARIPIEEFVHWVQDGPAGPAWHAILETDGAKIVGHHSVIPLTGGHGNGHGSPAKSEYTFLRNEFRTAKIRGLENSGKPTWLALLEHHLQHCCANGYGPLLISTTPALHRFCASIGSRRMDFPLWECLLVLRPWAAARDTPNLRLLQRASLGLAGACQWAAWSSLRLLRPRPAGLPSVPIEGHDSSSTNGSSTFFEDPAFLRWRYLQGQYERLAPDPGNEYVIVKKGSVDRYVRICQWRLGARQPDLSLIASLVQMARNERALGVRWAFYGNDEAASRFVGRMRKFGFLCARRVRTLLVYPKEQSQLAAKWRLTDAMFSFDP